jgi:hypothetical protein
MLENLSVIDVPTDDRFAAVDTNGELVEVT